MKTIEERAKEYSLKDFDGYYTGREKAMEEGYIAGATEQKAIDDSELSKLKSVWGNETQVNRRCYIKGYQDAVEKSCELLKERLQCGVHPQSAYGFVDRFRKAMLEK